MDGSGLRHHDVGIGLRREDLSWDVSLWAKNLLDTEYFTNIGSGSGTSAFTFTPGDRRSYGLTFRKKW